MVGTVVAYYFVQSRLHFVVDWVSEGFAPNVPSDAVVELPSEMHLIASV